MAEPPIEQALELAWAIYANPGGTVGGPFHITLDDGNVNVESILFCIEKAIELWRDPWPVYDEDGTAESNTALAVACIQLGGLLLAMTEDERQQVYRTHWDGLRRRWRDGQ